EDCRLHKPAGMTFQSVRHDHRTARAVGPEGADGNPGTARVDEFNGALAMRDRHLRQRWNDIAWLEIGRHLRAGLVRGAAAESARGEDQPTISIQRSP